MKQMKNIIKFRGKRIDNGEWVYGDLVRKMCIKGGQFHYICVDAEDEESEGFYYTVDASTVGQFTGLTDKNKKDIYVGDIVIWEGWRDDEKTEIQEIVVFTGGAFYPVCEMPPTEYEIIGNIHQNKDLLKSE